MNISHTRTLHGFAFFWVAVASAEAGVYSANPAVAVTAAAPATTLVEERKKRSMIYG